MTAPSRSTLATRIAPDTRTAPALLGRDRLVHDLHAGADDAEVRSRLGKKRTRVVRSLELTARRERVGVGVHELREQGHVIVLRRPQGHLRALREPIADTGVVEAARGVVPQEDDATAHARADPASRIAEDDGATASHVLEREAAQVAAEHDLRAGETDAGAGVRAALHEEASALRAVPEALPHRAVDEAALRVARLEHRDRSAERRLRGAVLRAAQERERYAVRRVRREAVPGDRAFAEARRDVLHRDPGDPHPGERARGVRRDEAIVGAQAPLRVA